MGNEDNLKSSANQESTKGSALVVQGQWLRVLLFAVSLRACGKEVTITRFEKLSCYINSARWLSSADFLSSPVEKMRSHQNLAG